MNELHIVTAQLGLFLRSKPSIAGQRLAIMPAGVIVRVGEIDYNNWATITAPPTGNLRMIARSLPQPPYYAHANWLSPYNPNEPFRFTHAPTPTPIYITQAYGVNPHLYRQFGLPGHEGIDFRAPFRSPVYAVAKGEVYRIITQREPARRGGHNYGIHVRIIHSTGHRTVYAHLDVPMVREGETVEGGQEIGKANNTGNSFGHHLHLTLYNPERQIINPTPFLMDYLNN